MSHLPVDARAILHYLNELGYRNISAEQLKEFLKDLRKLIKYEERMGVNAHQDDYYESLFRRTTASFRAKHNKENVPSGRQAKCLKDDVPTTSKQARQRSILQENNASTSYTNTSTDNSSLIEMKTQEVASKPTQTSSIRSTVEDIVAQILEEKFSKSTSCKKASPKGDKSATVNGSFMDPVTLKTIIQDLVNKTIKDKLYGHNEPASTKPLTSLIEDIVNEKLKEHLPHMKHTSNNSKNGDNVGNLSQELLQKLNLTNENSTETNKRKTLDSQALMADLLADHSSGKNQNPKQLSPSSRSYTPEWENLSGEKTVTGITRLPRSKSKLPEWQSETDGKSKTRTKSAQRPSSPVSSCGGRSSSRSRVPKTTSVLIPRSSSHGRSRKPNNADPVALYQYYKNEWDHFRKHIPGETNHNRLRWHVRQRFLDPE
ncbi:hyls1 centriolar and ciliogenesis associated [Musca autumnalis]|uniref:hyls1 centriolar and ciliogenesis associated n=1 Tax=Musca autumnalis TaxID=221902 RepID=UPI003CF52E05